MVRAQTPGLMWTGRLSRGYTAGPQPKEWRNPYEPDASDQTLWR